MGLFKGLFKREKKPQNYLTEGIARFNNDDFEGAALAISEGINHSVKDEDRLGYTLEMLNLLKTLESAAEAGHMEAAKLLAEYFNDPTFLKETTNASRATQGSSAPATLPEVEAMPVEATTPAPKGEQTPVDASVPEQTQDSVKQTTSGTGDEDYRTYEEAFEKRQTAFENDKYDEAKGLAAQNHGNYKEILSFYKFDIFDLEKVAKWYKEVPEAGNVDA